MGTGKKVKSYHIHGSCLTASSLFFKKALSGSWKESNERVVKLPKDKSDTFELYLNCIYGQEMSIEPDPIPIDHQGLEEQLELANLYVFAEKMQDVRTKNKVVKAFMQTVFKIRKDGVWFAPAVKVVRLIYENTLAGSPMRRLLVDIFAYAISHKYDWRVEHPKQFLIEVLVELSTARLTGCEGPALQAGDYPDNYLEKAPDGE